jgi:RNA polymerase sigma-70 factor, ECF subfamily
MADEKWEDKKWEDEKWMRRAALGDTLAFGRIVQAHQDRLLRFATRMLGGDRDAAQDAVQEAFLRLWRARTRYQSDGKLPTYLLRVVHNICLDHHRAYRPTAPLQAADGLSGGMTDDPHSDCQTRALADAVRRAVLELPEAQRAVFILSHYEELSYREIATVMECPVGTVASRKAQAVETLRRRLGAWQQEETSP